MPRRPGFVKSEPGGGCGAANGRAGPPLAPQGRFEGYAGRAASYDRGRAATIGGGGAATGGGGGGAVTGAGRKGCGAPMKCVAGGGGTAPPGIITEEARCR